MIFMDDDIFSKEAWICDTRRPEQEIRRKEAVLFLAKGYVWHRNDGYIGIPFERVLLLLLGGAGRLVKIQIMRIFGKVSLSNYICQRNFLLFYFSFFEIRNEIFVEGF